MATVWARASCFRASSRTHLACNVRLQVNELSGAIGGKRAGKRAAAAAGGGRGIAPTAGNQSEAARLRALALYNGKRLEQTRRAFHTLGRYRH